MDAITKLRIFVSHRNTDECPSLAIAYKVITEEVDKINHSGLHRDCIFIELQEYQYGRDISNPNNGTYQSAKSLKKDASKAHAIFILVDGEMSDKILDWYRPRSIFVRKEKLRHQVPMPIFWNISNPRSKANCEAFHKNQNSDFIYKYSSPEDLRDKISSELKELTRRWAASVERQRTIPTLRSNFIRHIRRFLIFSAIVLSFYFAWPFIKGLLSNTTSPRPPEQHSVHESQEKEGKGETESQQSSSINKEYLKFPKIEPIVDSGYSLDSGDIDQNFLITITSLIESNSELRQYPGKQVQWTIRLSESKYERGVDDGDFFVDLSVSATIINNKTGKALAQLPLFKRECVMSPLSYEDAFKEAADSTLAKQIADSIVNSISHEK